MDRIKALHAQRYKQNITFNKPIEQFMKMGSKIVDLFCESPSYIIDSKNKWALPDLSCFDTVANLNSKSKSPYASFFTKPTRTWEGLRNKISLYDAIEHIKIFFEKNKKVETFEQLVIALDTYDSISDFQLSPIILSFIRFLCEKESVTSEELYLSLKHVFHTTDIHSISMKNIATKLMSDCYRNGKNIFYLTPELTEMLIETDSVFDDNLLNLPFDTFYVALDMPFYMRVWSKFNPLKEESYIEGFYIRRAEGYKRIQLVVVIACKGEEDGYWEQYITIDPPSDLEFGGKTSLVQETHLVQMTDKEAKGYEYTIKSIHNAVINSVIYINCIQEKRIEVPAIPMTNSHKDKKINKSRNTCLERYVVLGSEYSTNSKTEESEGSGWRLKHKTWVRGHFRNQPTGPKISPTYKVIWIKPFIKGKEYEEEIHKTYLVDQNK